MFLRRLLCIWIVISFVFSLIIPPQRAYAQTIVNLPEPGTMVSLSSAYTPVLIKGLKINPTNPLALDFIVATGNSQLTAQDPQLKRESEKLIKYFFAALTLPEEDVWVNLSPYEKDRIIPQATGETEMGRDMLAQDYILKQITASLIYPEKGLGKDFWNKVYTEAYQRFGTTEVPVNTFNKVWIVADKASVYEAKDTVFVVDSHLKVMLEEDYLATSKHQTPTWGHVQDQTTKNVSPSMLPSDAGSNVKAPQGDNRSTNTLSSNIVREIILPALEKEVNEGKNFANLRQIFHSLILAKWYKETLKTALLNQVYSNKNKIGGLSYKNLPSPNASGPQAGHSQLFIGDPEAIYKQYLKAYKKGVFNYIKQDIDQTSKQPIPRKYFSGGVSAKMIVRHLTNPEFMSRAAKGLFLGLLLSIAVTAQAQDFFARQNNTSAIAKTSLVSSTRNVNPDTAVNNISQAQRGLDQAMVIRFNEQDVNQVVNAASSFFVLPSVKKRAREVFLKTQGPKFDEARKLFNLLKDKLVDSRRTYFKDYVRKNHISIEDSDGQENKFANSDSDGLIWPAFVKLWKLGPDIDFKGEYKGPVISFPKGEEEYMIAIPSGEEFKAVFRRSGKELRNGGRATEDNVEKIKPVLRAIEKEEKGRNNTQLLEAVYDMADRRSYQPQDWVISELMKVPGFGSLFDKISLRKRGEEWVYSMSSEYRNIILSAIQGTILARTVGPAFEDRSDAAMRAELEQLDIRVIDQIAYHYNPMSSGEDLMHRLFNAFLQNISGIVESRGEMLPIKEMPFKGELAVIIDRSGPINGNLRVMPVDQLPEQEKNWKVIHFSFPDQKRTYFLTVGSPKPILIIYPDGAMTSQVFSPNTKIVFQTSKKESLRTFTYSMSHVMLLAAVSKSQDNLPLNNLVGQYIIANEESLGPVRLLTDPSILQAAVNEFKSAIGSPQDPSKFFLTAAQILPLLNEPITAGEMTYGDLAKDLRKKYNFSAFNEGEFNLLLSAVLRTLKTYPVLNIKFETDVATTIREQSDSIKNSLRQKPFVLVIEDNEDAWHRAQDELNQYPWLQVIHATNTKTAQELIDEHINALGLVITASQFPTEEGLYNVDTDAGIKLANRLKTRAPKLPIVFNSSGGIDEERVGANTSFVDKHSLWAILRLVLLDTHPDNALVTQTSKLPKTAFPGGIDFNSARMQMNVAKQDAGIAIKFDPAMIEQFKLGNFDGIVPVITEITPITNIYPLLGLKEPEENEKLAA